MNFKWLNESKIMKDGDRIVITAPAKTDFFQGNIEECAEGILPESLSNAPFYYTEVEGDFVLRVKVSHAFTDVYDSASVMVMKDLTYWAKACFEHTDFHTHAVVSVVTRGSSDVISTAIRRGCRYAESETTLLSTTPWTASSSI